MKQVFAELPTRHTRFEILVRGRDHAHVDPDRELSTDPVELAFRQDTQQYVCSAGDMSPISSRKSVPPSACSNRPRRKFGCARKCALFVTEELGLEQVRVANAEVLSAMKASAARGL